jgi:hypothetical protein
MTKGWYGAYSGLTSFITGHAGIEIKANKVCLPDDIRPEFYRLFDATRAAFVEEKLPASLNEANNLSHNYIKVEQEVARSLKLENIAMEPGLQRFLHEPINQLIRDLFDPLFDLLKGLTAAEKFEETSRNIKKSFELLYQLGYGKWAALSLLKLLNADKLFQVTLRKLDSKDVHRARAGSLKEEAPGPHESNSLLFKHGPNAAFITPDWIIHSTKARGYISLGSQVYQALGAATSLNDKREWFPTDSALYPETGLTLLYQGDSPTEISLISDASKICRPELILECKALRDWFEREGLEKTKAYHDRLKPTRGTFVISMGDVPELKPEEQVEGITLLAVGLDSAKLMPVVEALTGGGEKGKR